MFIIFFIVTEKQIEKTRKISHTADEMMVEEQKKKLFKQNVSNEDTHKKKCVGLYSFFGNIIIIKSIKYK
jgi:hypothetical protein